MVLATWVIAWQAVQPRPAWASGSWIISRTGFSIIPENSGAGSWQPAHQRAGFVPTTSCMYSMDLRYHWLLKDEKWWALSFHWSKMSLWQRAQASDPRKKLLSIKCPAAVRL